MDWLLDHMKLLVGIIVLKNNWIYLQTIGPLQNIKK